MTRYAIDARTLLHIVARDIPVNPRHRLVAPSLIRSQALSLLLEEVRQGDLSESGALKQLERIAELKMRVLGDRVSRRMAWKLAREHDWETTYEAEYLAITKLQADALITIDPALMAMATGVVPLSPLEAITEDD